MDGRVANIKKQAVLGRARRDDNAAERRLRRAVADKANTEAKLKALKMSPLVSLDQVRDLRELLGQGDPL